MPAADSSVDLVFEGGGVKGIGLAGALATLEERGYLPQNVAGTSAGAINASLLAAGYTAAELREIIISLDYRQFKDQGWEDKVPLIERSLSLLLDLGLYEGTASSSGSASGSRRRACARSPTSSTPTSPTTRAIARSSR